MTIILRGIMGSHCHNLNTETSDVDIRGVAVKAEREYLFGAKQFDQFVVQNEEEDITIWELRKFIRLCLKCNTNGLNLLFCEERSITAKNGFGLRLREMRHQFLSNKMYPVLRGYHLAEYKHTVGETTGRLGEKRKKAIEKYGYSVKNASHCLRLLHTGSVTFETGTYPVWFEGNIRNTLYRVKTGQVGLAEFNKLYAAATERFEESFRTSKLPHVPDGREIWNEVLAYYHDLAVATAR